MMFATEQLNSFRDSPARDSRFLIILSIDEMHQKKPFFVVWNFSRSRKFADFWVCLKVTTPPIGRK